MKNTSEANRERLALYRKCAAQGMTRIEAAAHCGVTKGAIGHMARKYGIEFSARHHTDSRVPAYKKCAAQGMTSAEIASHCGVSVTSVNSAARLHGFKPKASKYGRNAVPDPLPEPIRHEPRFEVSGDIPGVGFRKHIITAAGADAAQAKFAAAYSAGRIVVDVELIGAVT